MVENNTATSDL